MTDVTVVVSFKDNAATLPDTVRSVLAQTHEDWALVLPSHYEGAPITLVEAQATGVPCVVSAAVSTASDVVPGLLERMGPDADADDWARRVLEVAARPRPSREVAQQAMAASPWALPEVLASLREVWSGATPARVRHTASIGEPMDRG